MNSFLCDNLKYRTDKELMALVGNCFMEKIYTQALFFGLINENFKGREDSEDRCLTWFAAALNNPLSRCELPRSFLLRVLFW